MPTKTEPSGDRRKSKKNFTQWEHIFDKYYILSAGRIGGIDQVCGTLVDLMLIGQDLWNYFIGQHVREAVEKCRGFSLGGHADSRLPSVDEWKTLIDSHRRAPALVEPNPFESIIIHMPYWIK